jgi:regulator of Ty1 transposition protein 109
MAPTNALAGEKREHKPNSLLVEKLASILPKGYKFGIHHISTPPTKTEALYSAPPDERDDKTYREDHFLAISIDYSTSTQPRQVLVFALEVFLFTTAYSTTLFVSKADSTGYLHLLHLPRGTPSPIREISAAFVSFLVEHRQRKNVQTVVSLFARAQSQYLFPGSVDNLGKHVLDDRGLVKWWCRVLNPLLEPPEERAERKRLAKWDSVTGYLIIPGLDHYETRAFLPRTPRASETWAVGHPLERISHYTKEYDWVPPRCLIPKYPDDPKSRFRDELDEEAAKRKQDTGMWKSVRTLDQFWDMMAFRQECSSGRLTGFVWIVFNPKGSQEPSQAAGARVPALLTPSSSFNAGTPSTPPRRRVDTTGTSQSSPLKKSMVSSQDSSPSRANQDREKEKRKRKKKLKGLIIPRQPKIKTEQRNYIPNRPDTTAFYHWPPEGRGEKIVDDSSYKRIVELLLHLDFATLEKACGSTARWIREVGIGMQWGREVVGTRETPVPVTGQTQTSTVTNLGAGLIKRKRPQNGSVDLGGQGAVNVLGSGLVRKKAREDVSGADKQAPQGAGAAEDITTARGVNVLGAGLVRKKPRI